MNKIIVFLFFFCAVVCSAQAKIFYSDGPQDVKRVALTFDDGPSRMTGNILEILKKKMLKLRFFFLAQGWKTSLMLQKRLLLRDTKLQIILIDT